MNVSIANCTDFAEIVADTDTIIADSIIDEVEYLENHINEVEPSIVKEVYIPQLLCIFCDNGKPHIQRRAPFPEVQRKGVTKKYACVQIMQIDNYYGIIEIQLLPPDDKNN